MPSRSSDSRTDAFTVASLRPGRASSEPVFVATTTSSRLPREAIQAPMIRSDSPPVLPGFHAEYTSAVSTKLPPPAAKASSTPNEASRSAVQPNGLPPRLSGRMSRSMPWMRAMRVTLDSPAAPGRRGPDCGAEAPPELRPGAWPRGHAPISRPLMAEDAAGLP